MFLRQAIIILSIAFIMIAKADIEIITEITNTCSIYSKATDETKTPCMKALKECSSYIQTKRWFATNDNRLKECLLPLKTCFNDALKSTDNKYVDDVVKTRVKNCLQELNEIISVSYA